MNIALIGYGKMGREIERTALLRRHNIALKIDVDNAAELTCANLQDIDAAIEFTAPSAAENNLKICFAAGTPVVCGTTGWLDRWKAMEDLCRANDGGLFYASNYSVGVNIFFAINRRLAQIMNRYGEDYRASVQEVHHTEKKDAPSGTAITLANDIVSQTDGLRRWVNEPSERREDLPIESIRRNPAVGTHTVRYEGSADTITLCHEARNRSGFALGAVLAAEFMQGRKGIYGMNDLLQLPL